MAETTQPSGHATTIPVAAAQNCSGSAGSRIARHRMVTAIQNVTADFTQLIREPYRRNSCPAASAAVAGSLRRIRPLTHHRLFRGDSQ
ncbi:hypothetical protein [Nocardia sp. NPDC003979]